MRIRHSGSFGNFHNRMRHVEHLARNYKPDRRTVEELSEDELNAILRRHGIDPNMSDEELERLIAELECSN